MDEVEFVKVICVYNMKSCNINEYYYATRAISDSEGELISSLYGIFTKPDYSVSYYKGDFDRKCFMPLSEFREQRINKILE